MGAVDAITLMDPLSPSLDTGSCVRPTVICRKPTRDHLLPPMDTTTCVTDGHHHLCHRNGDAAGLRADMMSRELQKPPPPPSDARGMGWAEKWEMGRRWELEAMTFLKGRGWFVLPVANLSSGPQASHGPRMEGLHSAYTVPDVLASKQGKTCWFEIKFKHALSYHRLTGKNEVGIPTSLVKHYGSLQKETGISVVLMFLVPSATSFDAYLSTLDRALKKSRHYDGPNMPQAMTFFQIDSFTKLTGED